MIEHALRTILVNNDGVKNLVNDRIYYNIAPQGTTIPYIVFFKIAGPREHSHDGKSGLAHPRFQFSVFADTYLKAKQITQAIQNALDCFTGEIEDTAIKSCLYINEVDMYDAQAGLNHVASDYEIYHREG
jgi:hypothetical protein